MKKMLFLILFVAGLRTPCVAGEFFSSHFCKPNQIGGQASIIVEYQNQGPLLALDNMILTCPIFTTAFSPSAAADVSVMYDSSAVSEVKPIICKLSRTTSTP